MTKKKIKLEDYRIPFFRIDDFMFALDREEGVGKLFYPKLKTYVVRMLKDIDARVGLDNLFPTSKDMNPHKEVIAMIRKSKE